LEEQSKFGKIIEDNDKALEALKRRIAELENRKQK
jgi:restriction endonuclease S subunit